MAQNNIQKKSVVKKIVEKGSSDFDLELSRIVSEIKKTKAKNVLIQLPDGLKPQGPKICDYIQNNTLANPILWTGSNFGACDIPIELESMKIDLLVHFGHTVWKR